MQLDVLVDDFENSNVKHQIPEMKVIVKLIVQSFDSLLVACPKAPAGGLRTGLYTLFHVEHPTILTLETVYLYR